MHKTTKIELDEHGRVDVGDRMQELVVITKVCGVSFQTLMLELAEYWLSTEITKVEEEKETMQ